MRLVVGKTSLWVAVTLLCAAVALGQGGGQRGAGGGAGGGAGAGGGQRGGRGGQPGGAPAGNAAGAAILQRACAGCHAADSIGSYHYESPAEYRDVVNSMVAAGAQVSAQELPVLVAYLFETYGKKQDAGAAPAAAANDPGKAILDAGCTSCHGLEGLANHVYDTRAPYESLIGNMVAYGATITPAQVPPLADYLLKTYGKKPAAAPGTAAPAGAAATPDPGKGILDVACTSCHGLDGLANHVYPTKEPYESLVKNMVAYGATVSDAQLPALVDYMFKTYGKK